MPGRCAGHPGRCAELRPPRSGPRPESCRGSPGGGTGGEGRDAHPRSARGREGSQGAPALEQKDARGSGAPRRLRCRLRSAAGRRAAREEAPRGRERRGTWAVGALPSCSFKECRYLTAGKLPACKSSVFADFIGDSWDRFSPACLCQGKKVSVLIAARCGCSDTVPV